MPRLEVVHQEKKSCCVAFTTRSSSTERRGATKRFHQASLEAEGNVKQGFSQTLDTLLGDVGLGQCQVFQPIQLGQSFDGLVGSKKSTLVPTLRRGNQF